MRSSRDLSFGVLYIYIFFVTHEEGIGGNRITCTISNKNTLV